jgi:hypothetical protein
VRFLARAALVWLVVCAWAWTFGPVGFVAGGAAFLGGWALGHRTGRHDAERDQMERAARYLLEQRTEGFRS